MLKRLKKNFNSSYRLIKNGFGTLFLFELVFKLVTAGILIPSMAWIIGQTAELSGLKFISGENYIKALLSPAIIAELLIFAVILSALTMYEISYLTLCFNQTNADKPIFFLRMLKISAMDSLRLLKPKNHLMFPVIALATPLTNTAIIYTMISKFTIPQFIAEKILDRYRVEIYLIAAVALLFMLIIFCSNYFIIFCLEDCDSKQALKTNRFMLHKDRLKRLFICSVNIGIYCIVIFLASELLYVAYSLIISIFQSFPAFYALLLTGSSVITTLRDFFVPTLMVVCGYSVVCTYYFDRLKEIGEPMPRVEKPIKKEPKVNNFYMGLFITTAVGVWILSAAYTNAKSDIAGFSTDIIIMAHRGASAECPENTIPAFERAIELQADYIELDVQETADGKVVVFHDKNTRRTTGHSGVIWNMTLAELKELDAGRFYEEYRGTQIPTLEEVLELSKGRIKLNIEIKSNKHTMNLVESVAKLITEYEMQEDVVITSSVKGDLKQMKQYLPDVECGLIVSATLGNYYDYPYADFFSADKFYISKRPLSKIHRQGKGVVAWTVNDTDYIEKMIAIGVEGIITDDPLKAREKLNEANSPLRILRYLMQNK
ncbi:MAG: glycerophosphodiester phosphodiesterase family protein [Clostridia bacterium]|nr:glycerophosphodiester phosphodiesterase family protein [Clostridia bacterium]